MNTVNDITDLRVSDRDIKTLKVGNFVLVDGLHGTVERVYLQPHGVPDDIAVRIVKEANPDLAESYIIEYEKSQLLEVDEDLTYKPLWLEEKDKREKLEQEFEQRLDQERQKIAVQAQETVDKRLQEIAETYVPKAQFKEVEDKLEALEKDAAFGRRFKDLLQEIIPMSIPTAPSVTMADVDERINQRFLGAEPSRVVTVDVDQRIKELVKNETVNRIVAKIRALPDPAKKAAWWVHEKKQVNVKALFNYVYDRPLGETGRVPGAFYMNVINPLEESWLIINKGGIIHWSLQEKLADELKDVLSNSDLEKVPKYLASLLL